MNNRKLLFLIGGFLVLAIIMFGVLVSCGPKKEKPKAQTVTLNFWTVYDDQEKLQPIIDKFEKTHSGIKIAYKKLTYQEYQQVLNESFAAGKGPDIFSVQNYWMPKYFDKISPIPEKDYKTEDYKKDFYPAVADTIQDNRVYAIPMTMDVLGLYVNDELVGKAEPGQAPKTWEDLVGNPETKKPNALTGLNNRQGNTFNQSAIALGTATVPRSADILALMMLQQRTQMTNQDKTQATFNLTQTVNNKEVNLGTDALKFYNSFANPATENYSWNAAAGDPVAAFTRGKLVMMVAYAYQVPVIDRQNPDMTYSVKQVPQIAGSEPVNYANYWAEAVAKNSKHSQEAWEFVRYMTDQDQMELYAQGTRQLPARKAVQETDEKLTDLRKSLETAQTWYKGDAEKADEYFVRMIGQVLAGETPQNAINRAANDLTEVYKQLNADQ